MAATFEWQETNGAGTTVTSATAVNWKNIDNNTTDAYTAYPITAGNNSYTKYQSGYFYGAYNQILNGKYAHTAGDLTNITLWGSPACTGDGDRIQYAEPSTATHATLTEITVTTAIASGRAVFFGATSANATGKAASMTTVPCWSSYIATQLRTTASASAGDCPSITITLSYDEN